MFFINFFVVFSSSFFICWAYDVVFLLLFFPRACVHACGFQN